MASGDDTDSKGLGAAFGVMSADAAISFEDSLPTDAEVVEIAALRSELKARALALMFLFCTSPCKGQLALLCPHLMIVENTLCGLSGTVYTL
jgi:hypothetical protein